MDIFSVISFCFVFFVSGTRKTTNYVVLFRITNEEFSHDLKDSSSPAFKRLADNLDREVKFWGELLKAWLTLIIG